MRSAFCLKHSRRSGKVLREENDSPIRLASTYIRCFHCCGCDTDRGGEEGRGKGGPETSCGKYIWLRRGKGDARRGWLGEAEAVAERVRSEGEDGNIAAATPHINIPGKSARVKHLFSTRGFSKWRESGCSNSAEATITRLAGRLSICILSTEEFITVRAHSLPRLFLSRLYMLYWIAPFPFPPPLRVLLLLLSEFSFFLHPRSRIGSRAACRFSPTHFPCASLYFRLYSSIKLINRRTING